MSNIEEIRLLWSGYAWPEHGDEWSSSWGGTPYLWHAVVYPRILDMIPAENGLEIGPGHGRFTHYLKDFCRGLRLVDVTAECIAECRKRFARSSHLSYHVNDGVSLRFVPPNSLDFVFSFDSLVHAEEDVIAGYLAELGDLMRQDALAFMHHSNMAALGPDALRRNPAGRAESMSADRFAELCASYEFDCIAQETVNWGSAEQATDCFSVFTPRGSRRSHDLRRRENLRFMAEAADLAAVAALYSSNG